MPDIANSNWILRLRVGRSFLSVWRWGAWDMRVNHSSICAVSWVSRNKRPSTSSMRWRKQLSIVATRSSQLGIKSVGNRSHRWMYRSGHNHLLSAEQGVYKSKKYQNNEGAAGIAANSDNLVSRIKSVVHQISDTAARIWRRSPNQHHSGSDTSLIQMRAQLL